MDKNEVIKQLTTVFRDVFDNSTIELSENTTALDIEEWDSFEHVNLMLAVEEEFEVDISMKESTSFKNVGELADIIIQKKNSSL